MTIERIQPGSCSNPPGRIEYPSGVSEPSGFPSNVNVLENDIAILEKAAIIEELVNDFLDWAMALDPNDPAATALNQPSFNPFFEFLVSAGSPLAADAKTRLTALRSDSASQREAFRTAADEFISAAAPTPDFLEKAALIEALVNDFLDWAMALPPTGTTSIALNSSNFNPFFNSLKIDAAMLSTEARAHAEAEEAEVANTMWRDTLSAWKVEYKRLRLPTQTQNPTVTARTADAATLRWDRNTSRTDGHRVLYMPVAGGTHTEVTFAGASTGDAIRNLNPDTAYEVVVVPYNDVGCGPVSDIQTFQTLPNTPGEVTNLRVIEPTFPWNSVEVEFGPPSPATGTATPVKYLIDYRRVDENDWSTPIEIQHVAGQPSYDVTIDGLREVEDYEIRVRAQTNPIGPEAIVTARTTSMTEGDPLLTRWYKRMKDNGGMLWAVARLLAPEDLQLRFGQALTVTGDPALIPPSGYDANGGYGFSLRWSTSRTIGEDTGLPQGLTAALHYQRDGKDEPAIFSGGSTWNRTVPEVNGALVMDNPIILFPFVLALGYSNFETGTVSPFGLNPHPLRRNWFNTDSGEEFSAVGRFYLRGLEHRLAGIPRDWLRSFVEINYRTSNANRNAGPELPYEGLSGTVRSEGAYLLARARLDTEFGHDGGWRAGVGAYRSMTGRLTLGGQRVTGGSTSTGFESSGGVESISTNSDSTAQGLEGSIGYGDLEVAGTYATENNGAFEDTNSLDLSLSWQAIDNIAARGAGLLLTVAAGQTQRNLRPDERVRERYALGGIQWGLPSRSIDGWVQLNAGVQGGAYQLDSRFGNESGWLVIPTLSGTFGGGAQAEATDNLRNILRRRLP